MVTKIKKFILIFLLLFSFNALAEDSPFPKHDVKPIVYTECQAGHLFVVAASMHGVAIMQIFEDEGGMVPKPIECKVDDKDDT